jgi:hypothetical protein
MAKQRRAAALQRPMGENSEEKADPSLRSG